MLLTLVFLKFISERYHDRCKEIREENADEPEYAEMLITQKRTAFGEKGVFMLSPETDWESLKLIAPKGLAGKQRLMPFFNRQNNDDLILAIQAAGVSRGRNGFRKDKGGQKPAESEEDLLQHRTDGTDAFDTLYIGAEKFPYRESYAFPTTGIL